MTPYDMSLEERYEYYSKRPGKLGDELRRQTIEITKMRAQIHGLENQITEAEAEYEKLEAIAEADSLSAADIVYLLKVLGHDA